MNEINDRQLAQWISQQLAGELNDANQAKLRAALQHSPASQAFAEWSSRIQAAAAETQRIESMQPHEAAVDPAECLSELSKARLQRSVLTALTEGRDTGESQLHLRVAQSPSVYTSRTAADEEIAEEVAAVERAGQASEASQDFDELMRGGRELRGRLIAHFSGMLQTLQCLVELVRLANLQNATTGVRPPPATFAASSSAARSAARSASSSGQRFIGLEQLAGVVECILRVQTGLCAVSIARCEALNFDELLRVQRGPRELSELRLLPADRLRHAAASPFHLTVLAAPRQTPAFDLDRSVAGWDRIVLGSPLTTPQLQVEETSDPSTATHPDMGVPLTSHRWGLAIVEADIDRLVDTHIVAAGIDARVTLIDQHDRVVFCTPLPSGAPGKAVTKLSASKLWPARDIAQTGELHLPTQGVWATLLNCPPPLDNLRLVLSRSE